MIFTVLGLKIEEAFGCFCGLIVIIFFCVSDSTILTCITALFTLFIVSTLK